MPVGGIIKNIFRKCFFIINFLTWVYTPLLWVYPLGWAKPGVYTPYHTGFTTQMGSPPRFEAKG